MTRNRISTDEIELIYRADDGQELTQPLTDVTEVGTLIDPETGDDMEIAEAIIISDDTTGSPVVNELVDALRDRGDDASQHAAEFLAKEGENDDVWFLIGRLLDQITDMAQHG